MIRIAEQPDAPLTGSTGWHCSLALHSIESRADAALHAFRGNRTDRSQHIEHPSGDGAVTLTI